MKRGGGGANHPIWFSSTRRMGYLKKQIDKTLSKIYSPTTTSVSRALEAGAKGLNQREKCENKIWGE